MLNLSKVSIALICIALFAVSTAYGVELTSTGINDASGGSLAEGDTFAIENGVIAGQSATTGLYDLYVGAWAHALVPTGQTGYAYSARDSLSRSESRPQTMIGQNFDVKLSYTGVAVIANVTKSTSLGTAEAFAEVSSRGTAEAKNTTAGANNWNYMWGNATISAQLNHTGTGTGQAAASGAADYLVARKMKGTSGATTEYDQYVTGGVNGAVSLTATNTYGGSVTGYARKAASSMLKNWTSDNAALTKVWSNYTAETADFVSLASSRTLSAGTSNIHGSVADTAATQASAVVNNNTGAPYATASVTGTLTADANTYQVQDSITGIEMDQPALLINGIKTKRTSSTAPAGIAKWTPLESVTLGNIGMPVSAILMANSTSSSVKSATSGLVGGDHANGLGQANGEIFTAARAIRTSTDLSNEAFSASYIDNGRISAAAINETTGVLWQTSATNAFFGSGAHLNNRITGADNPASWADLVLQSYSGVINTYRNRINRHEPGLAKPGVVAMRSVGPVLSGNVNDAAGSYLSANSVSLNALGTSGATQGVSTSIGTIDMISWLSGDDSRFHAESSTGLFPYVSLPVGVPTGNMLQYGPSMTPFASVTMRRIDVDFGIYNHQT